MFASLQPPLGRLTTATLNVEIATSLIEGDRKPEPVVEEEDEAFVIGVPLGILPFDDVLAVASALPTATPAVERIQSRPDTGSSHPANTRPPIDFASQNLEASPDRVGQRSAHTRGLQDKLNGEVSPPEQELSVPQSQVTIDSVNVESVTGLSFQETDPDLGSPAVDSSDQKPDGPARENGLPDVPAPSIQVPPDAGEHPDDQSFSARHGQRVDPDRDLPHLQKAGQPHASFDQSSLVSTPFPAEPAAESPPALRVADETRILDQVQTTLAAHDTEYRTDEPTHLEVHLDPPELGRIWIRVERTEHGLSAQLSAQNSDVRTALEAHFHDIRQALTDSGLSFSGFELADHRSRFADAEPIPRDSNVGGLREPTGETSSETSAHAAIGRAGAVNLLV